MQGGLVYVVRVRVSNRELTSWYLFTRDGSTLHLLGVPHLLLQLLLLHQGVEVTFLDLVLRLPTHSNI